MTRSSSARSDEGSGRDSISARRARAGSTEEYRQRRAQLVRFAAELFHARGLAETSLADIAAAAGMDRANVYYYFANKEEILAEVLRVALDQSSAVMQRVSRKRVPPEEKLRQLIVTMMRLFDEHYPYLYVYVRQDMDAIRELPIPSELKDWLVDESYRSTRVWTNVVSDGLRSGVFESDLPPNVVTSTLLGAISWSHRWYRPDGPMTARDLGEALASLLVDGLRRR